MRTIAPLRSLAALVTILAWLALSNHCAFAALSASATAPAACPMHSQPKKPAQNSTIVCCKILKAPNLPTMAKQTPPQVQIFPLGCACFFPRGAQLDFEPLFLPLDTGPPGLRSFAESVLQRSVLAHAPPSLG